MSMTVLLSVYDKRFIEDLASVWSARRMPVYGSEGSRQRIQQYYLVGGSLQDLVGQPDLDREDAALEAAKHLLKPPEGLIAKGLLPVDVVCCNLNPSRGDVGGIAMISAACDSGLVTLTRPSQYRDYLAWEKAGRPNATVKIQEWIGEAWIELTVYAGHKGAELLGKS